MTTEPIIELRNVTAWRGATRVFSGLNLIIRKGGHTVILGPNGAGKTTLLKLLTRELYPVQEEGAYLRLFGKDRWNVAELRSRLGMVSQDLQENYSGQTTGIDVVLSGLYSSIGAWDHQAYTDADRECAAGVANELGVLELSGRPFAAMSTGQQRRFLLGRALINDPEALVLDEPTGGLDLAACFQYLEIVRGLMGSGKTIVLVTHHLHEIPPGVDRVILLKRGKIAADGAKDEVLTNSSLSELFNTPVSLVKHNGFYQAFPA